MSGLNYSAKPQDPRGRCGGCGAKVRWSSQVRAFVPETVCGGTFHVEQFVKCPGSYEKHWVK